MAPRVYPLGWSLTDSRVDLLKIYRRRRPHQAASATENSNSIFAIAASATSTGCTGWLVRRLTSELCSSITPSLYLGLPYIQAAVSADYQQWPKLPARLLGPTSSSHGCHWPRGRVQSFLRANRPVSIIMAIPDHPWTKASADAAASGPPLYGVVKRAKMPLNDDTKAGYEKAANMSAVRFLAC